MLFYYVCKLQIVPPGSTVYMLSIRFRFSVLTTSTFYNEIVMDISYKLGLSLAKWKLSLAKTPEFDM